MKKVIIDTDPGIDDAAALLLALASPELSVVAITTGYGNGPLEVTTQNATEYYVPQIVPMHPFIPEPISL